MRILVLGGSGFIGTHLVAKLCSLKYKVRVFDRGCRTVKKFAGVEYFQGDFGDSIELEKALKNVDLVIHAISTTIPATSNLNPTEDIKTNLINTVNLLQLMRKFDIKRIIYLSSGGTVYGVPHFLPITENHSQNPICSYGIVKLAIEKYLFLYQQLYSLTPVVFRISNPYGPGQHRLGIQGAISTFLTRVINKETIHIWGDGSVIRDYIYITDLVDAFIRALESDVSGVFNIGSSMGHSLLDVLNSIENITNIKAIVEHKPCREFDIQEVVLDCGLAEEKFGWKAMVSMEQGIEYLYDWIIDNN